MKKLFQSSDFKCTSYNQCEVIIHTMQEKKDLPVALLTGSGKSIVLMLAVMLGSGKTFLVIISLISLLEKWKYQLKLSCIRYNIFWHGMHVFPDSPIVLANIDLTIKSDLIECIGNAYAHKSFGRVVIDEFHDILVSCEF